MKPIKQFTALCLCSAMLLAKPVAFAAASQFGSNAWTDSALSSHSCCICGQDDCHTTCTDNCISLCPSIYWTAAPAQPTPSPMQTPEQTKAPVRSPAPAVTSTPKPVLTPSATESMGDYTPESLSMQEQKVWNLLNQDRINNGLSTLPLDSALSQLARLKSRDMAENHYFAHTSPTYGSASDMLRTFGYAFTSVGENIAHHATIEKSQAAFMSSTGHRRNILGSQWSKVGIGVWTDEQGYVYVTQLFVR